MEGCSKSHFLQIRDEIEKRTLGPLILERFLEPKSSQDPKKVVSKSFYKFLQFLISFFIDFDSILDPPGDPKIRYF